MRIHASSHPNPVFEEYDKLVNEELEDILSLFRIGRLGSWVYTNDKKIAR